MYKIYDNVNIDATKNFYEEINQNNFPWFIGNSVDLSDTVRSTNVFINPEEHNIGQKVFVHMAIVDGKPNSGMHERVAEYIQNFCASNGIEYDYIIRAQFNCVLQTSCNLPSLPHIDNDKIEHGVLLFYLHDTDGDTVFYDSEGKRELVVSPKEGRAVAFDGSHVHSGGTPNINPVRMVLNVNLFNMRWK